MEKKLKDNRIIRRYSEAFKHKVLKSIREGRYTKSEASRIFGVSLATIFFWIRSYDVGLYNTRVRVEDFNEQDRLKALQTRISELEKALADSQLQQFKSQSFLQVAAEKLGYSSWEDFEKKNGRPPYGGQ